VPETTSFGNTGKQQTKTKNMQTRTINTVYKILKIIEQNPPSYRYLSIFSVND